MADISRLSRLLNGVQRGVDISANTLVTLSVKVGGGISNTELTKALLDRLVTLQDGSTVAGTYHKHDAVNINYTQSDGSKIDIQASSDDVESALRDLDSDKISKAGLVTFTANQPMGSHKLTGLSAGSGAGDSVRYEQTILVNGANAFSANQPMGGNKLTGLSAGTTAGDSVRYEQAILTSGANAFGADQSMGGHKLTNLADPTTGTDAVNVNYLSARLAGLKPKQAVRAATTVAGTLATSFANGSVIDGVTLATSDRILIKDQSSAAENGIYTVNASGAPTRATDFDSVSPIDEINGAWVSVQEGTANAGKVYVQFGTVAVIDTDAINFEYFNPIASLIGGDMITFAGSTFSVDLATASGLESTNPGNNAGQLRIKLEASNPSLKFTGSNELAAKLDPAGAITSGSSGLIVGVDGSTIEISSNALRVKDLGITTAKIAADAVTDAKIRLTNNNYLRARNNAGSGDVNILKVNTSDRIFFASLPQSSDTPAVANDLTNKSYVDSLTGVVSRTVVVGEAFLAAGTVYMVRWAVNGETEGRVYNADEDASVSDLFHVVGIITPLVDLSPGDSTTMLSLGTKDFGFNVYGATDIGKPIFLSGTGGNSLTPPSTANHAVVIIGYVESQQKIDVKPQIMGVN